MIRTRRHDVDWLRVAAVYLLVPFHVARVFDHHDWHVKNAVESDVLDLFTGAVRVWHMPLLFALAGWAIGPSLERRDRHAFARERRERLLVPFLFGCAALMPPATYVELRHKGEIEEGFVEFLPSFVPEHFTWMHLWFLIYLFVFTALYSPGFRWAREREWSVERVPAWAVYAAIVPFAVVQVTLRGRWPGYQNLYDDWANFAYYSLFFVAGFVLTRLPAVERAVHAEPRRAACVAVGALAGMALAAGGFWPPAEGSARWVAFQALSAVAAFCTVAALLGFAAERLRRGGERLAYARDSAMPVYVLHQPAIIFLAAPIVGLSAGVPVKFGLLLGSAGAVTLAAYHLAVRRSPLLGRVLGGRARGLRQL